jgi:hypothetical protein
MREQITSDEPNKKWHPRLAYEEGLYRASPYEFAETSDSCLQLITVAATIHLGHTIVFKSPLSETRPSSSLILEGK